MSFGPRLRALRLDADLTQRELARRASIDYTYLSKIEAGVVGPPGDDRIADLAAALNLDEATRQELMDLAHQSKVPTEVVRAAMIRNPGVGALLRRIKDRQLSQAQIDEMLTIADGGTAQGKAEGSPHDEDNDAS